MGVEGGLNYQTFNVVSSIGSPLVQPPSQKNYIFAGLVGQVTVGQPQLLPAPKVQYFDLKKISYACTVNSGLKAVSCTILVAGLKSNNRSVFKELVYNPGPVTDISVKQFSSAEFPGGTDGFTNLVGVTVSVISSAVTSGLTNVLFDNVGYSACVGP